MHFSTFTHVCQIGLLITFLMLFKNFLNRFEQHDILRILIPFSFCEIKIVLCHINQHFLQTLRPNGHKAAQKIGKKFCKCVLDFNFEPTTGSVFYIFFKKANQICCTLISILPDVYVYHNCCRDPEGNGA